MNHTNYNFREYFKRYPNFYYFIAFTFGPLYLLKYGPKWYIHKFKPSGLCLNLGSGPKVVDKNFKNVDLFKYDTVDYVCNISNTPFEENEVDSIIIDNVLEHIKDPKQVVDEMYRILKSGSTSYVSVPFIYPFHSSPYDYNRWTHTGLMELFNKFETVEIGARSGIFSSLNTLLVYIFATIFSFGNAKIYDFLTNLFIFVFFPIKLLDFFTLHLPHNLDSACVFYMVVRKR